MVSPTSSFTRSLAYNLLLTIACEAYPLRGVRSLWSPGALGCSPQSLPCWSLQCPHCQTSAHLQFEHFLLFQLHPSLLLLCPLGLGLSLLQLLGLCFQPQPSHPARGKKPRVSGAADEPSPPSPLLTHRSPCSRRFSSRFQAISSRCSVMASCALRSARTPARASCNFLRTSNLNSSLGEVGLQVSSHPPAPALPRGRRRALAPYTHLRARTVSRYCR